MSVLFEPEDEIDHIAEFADSGVRIFQRRGSLVGVPGTYGLKRWLYRRWRNNGNAVYTFVGSLLAIGLSGTWAYLVKQPLVFPSLGATAFLIFETPMAEVGTPRNTVLGHTVGVLAGALSLAIFGLLNAPSVYVSGITVGRVCARSPSLWRSPAVCYGCSAPRIHLPAQPRSSSRPGCSTRRARCWTS